MKITFFFEHGAVEEIGIGHLYRVKTIAEELKKRGHSTTYIEGGVLSPDNDILVIDHIYPQKELIARAKELGIKVVLVDGNESDVSLVDISISAFTNSDAKYKGMQYMTFPTTVAWERYRPYNKSNSVFVGMGGYDANNRAGMIIKILDKIGLKAVVAKSINHPNFKEQYSNVEMFEEEDYYTAMRECIIGVVNGGLTFFQALYYGLPCVAVPQYERQKHAIDYMSHCCLPAEPNEEDITLKIKWLMDSSYFREDISRVAQHFVDGKGTTRICNLIEGLK